MNSGEPGSPRSDGPPFHAHQYVRQLPSASRFRFELIPFSRTRMLFPLRNPAIKIAAAARSLGASRVHHDSPVRRKNLDRGGAWYAFECAGNLSLAEAGEAARLAWFGH